MSRLWNSPAVILFTAGLLLLAMLVLAPLTAHAQTSGTFFELRGARSAANLLGWIAIAAGVVGTGSFMVYSMMLRRSITPVITEGRRSSSSVEEGRRLLATVRRPLLNFHLGMNSIGFFSGMAHGLFLLRGLDYVSLTLAISMGVAVGSGLLLKFGSRRIKLYNFQLHGNISLVLLIVLLTGMHVLFVRGGE